MQHIQERVLNHKTSPSSLNQFDMTNRLDLTCGCLNIITYKKNKLLFQEKNGPGAIDLGFDDWERSGTFYTKCRIKTKNNSPFRLINHQSCNSARFQVFFIFFFADAIS